jgi:DNA-binding GntR family transcriptional regulator
MGRRPKSAPTRAPSVREKAYRHIQRLIADGVLEAGSGISELLLAKELGSSRTPIREAMSQLAAEGLLEVSPNGGMVVAQLKREDIIELYELREALEVYAVGKVARVPLRPADKDRLQFLVDMIGALEKELEERGAKELDAEQMQRFIACDLGFHALLMSMTHNSRIQKIIHETRLLIRIFAIQRHGHTKPELESIRNYHQRVLDAVANRDEFQAMEALAAHIQESQRERLNEYDHWRRESALRQNMPAIFDSGSIEPLL